MRWATIPFVVAFSLSPSTALAAAGDLDDSFGDNGRVTYRGATLTGDLAIQPDGKIVVVGSNDFTGLDEFIVVRFRPNGQRDTSFGNNGAVKTTFAHSQFAIAEGVALQPNGKIVVAGWTNGQRAGFAVARYRAGGTLDPTFSDNGRVITSFPPHGIDQAYGVGIQPDGKIVVVGSGGPTFEKRFAFARYRRDGTLDPSFDGNGKTRVDFPGTFAGAQDVAIQPDGSIVAAGTGGQYGNEEFAVARLTPDGEPDPAFSSGGILTTAIGTVSRGSALELQPDGSIVVAGRTDDSWALVRYLSDGTPDASFGDDGIVTTAFAKGSGASDLAIQTDGRIVAAGFSGLSGRPRSFALVRYLGDGGLDTSFSGDGKVRIRFERDLWQAKAVGIQSNGRIVAAGDIYFPDPNAKWVMARVHAV